MHHDYKITKKVIKSNPNEKNKNIEDIFQQRMLSDLLRHRPLNTRKKYKTYHSLLLDKLIEKGPSRGKMINYIEYNCYNSDEDSSDEPDSFNSSLFNRYGMTSRIIEASSKALPKWNTTKKSQINKINSNVNDPKVLR
jgi:hypothetical protein